MARSISLIISIKHHTQHQLNCVFLTSVPETLTGTEHMLNHKANPKQFERLKLLKMHYLITVIQSDNQNEKYCISSNIEKLLTHFYIIYGSKKSQ